MPILQKLPERKLILLIILLSSLVKLAWILSIKTTPVSDCAWFFKSATEISQDFSYTDFGVPTAYFPVGYPLFLSLFFYIFSPDVFVAQLLNVILYGFIVYFIYALSKKWFGSEKKALLAAAILAFYPNHIAYSALLFSEIYYIFLLSAATYVFTCTNLNVLVKTILIAFLIALATLIKPFTIYLPGVLFISSFIINRKITFTSIRTAAILYVAIFVFLSPWTYRNYTIWGKPILVSTNGGINLLIGNNPEAKGFYQLSETVTTKIAEARVFGEHEADKILKKEAVSYILANPKETFLLGLKKLYYLYYLTGDGFSWNARSNQFFY